jgi:hypothetical protein
MGFLVSSIVALAASSRGYFSELNVTLTAGTTLVGGVDVEWRTWSYGDEPDALDSSMGSDMECVCTDTSVATSYCAAVAREGEEGVGWVDWRPDAIDRRASCVVHVVAQHHMYLLADSGGAFPLWLGVGGQSPSGSIGVSSDPLALAHVLGVSVETILPVAAPGQVLVLDTINLEVVQTYENRNVAELAPVWEDNMHYAMHVLGKGLGSLDAATAIAADSTSPTTTTATTATAFGTDDIGLHPPHPGPSVRPIFVYEEDRLEPGSVLLGCVLQASGLAFALTSRAPLVMDVQVEAPTVARTGTTLVSVSESASLDVLVDGLPEKSSAAVSAHPPPYKHTLSQHTTTLGMPHTHTHTHVYIPSPTLTFLP